MLSPDPVLTRVVVSGGYICSVGTKHEPETLKFEYKFSDGANTGQRKIEQRCEREIGTLTGTATLEKAREQDVSVAADTKQLDP